MAAFILWILLISSGGLWKQEKTKWVSVGMVLAIFINIVLAVLLVPAYQLIGAAAATAVAFLVWNIFTVIISEMLWPVHYPFGVFGLQIGAGVLAVTSILLLYAQSLGNMESGARGSVKLWTDLGNYS